MSLVKVPISGMYNGVSTQNPALRLITQGEVQENFEADLINGLQLRKGTVYKHSLEALGNTLLYSCTLMDEKLFFYFTGDDIDPITVLKEDGTRINVVYTGNKPSLVGYLTTLTPNTDLKLISLKDTLICLNTTVPTYMTSNKTLPIRHKAIIIVNGTQTSYLYRVKLKCEDKAIDITADYSAAGSPLTNTTIAGSIASKILSVLPANHGFTVLAMNNKVLIMRFEDTIDFNVEISDTYTGTLMTVIKDTVNSIDDLPADATFNRLNLKFLINNDKNNSGYYMEYDYINKLWKETTGYNVYTDINTNFMPLKLSYDGTDTVTVEQIYWTQRSVGDDTTCPIPSFVYQEIKDIFFYKNRLGFLTGSGIVFSRSGDIFNFWNSTALDVLDDDPIDYDILSTKHAELSSAIPTSAGLFLKSNEVQYIMHSGDQPFTPKTVIIDEVSNYKLSSCNIVKSEASLYLVSQFGSVYEYLIDGDNFNVNGNDITLHVQGYLPRTLKKAVSIENKIIYQDYYNRDTLYLYQYTVSGEKIQNSWSKWVFDSDIIDISTLDNKLYLLAITCLEESTCCLLEMDFDKKRIGNLDIRIHVDCMSQVTGVYNPIDDTTTFKLPFTDKLGYEAKAEYVIIEIMGGQEINNVIFKSYDTLVVKGDYTKWGIYVAGRKFKGKYTFSKQYARNSETGVGDPTVKLQYKRITLSYRNAYTFDVIVQSKGREPIKQTYVNSPIGIATLNKTTLAEGDFKTLIFGDRSTDITIEVYGWTPCNFIGAVIEGLYISNSQSI